MNKKNNKPEPVNNPKSSVTDELEKIEIISRLFHNLSLKSLRKLEAIVLPKGEVFENIKA